jgi:hypothetical protein
MENSSAPSTEADSGQEGRQELSAGFDGYRSVSDPSLMIFVAKDVVPPFRFKAGGWELFQSSTDLGSAMKARIGEKGFFLFRANEDRTGGGGTVRSANPVRRAGAASEGKLTCELSWPR